MQISIHALLERTADLEAVVMIDCNISITEVDDLACTIENKTEKVKSKSFMAVSLDLLQPSIDSGVWRNSNITATRGIQLTGPF